MNALLLNERKAAAYVGVSVSTLRKWRTAGRIGRVQPDAEVAQWYYRRDDLDRFVAELEAAS